MNSTDDDIRCSIVLTNGQSFITADFEGRVLECFEQRCHMSELTNDFRNGYNDSSHYDDSTTATNFDDIDDIQIIQKSITETSQTVCNIAAVAAQHHNNSNNNTTKVTSGSESISPAATAGVTSTPTTITTTLSSSSSSSSSSEIRNQSIDLLNRCRIKQQSQQQSSKHTNKTTSSKHLSKILLRGKNLEIRASNKSNDMTPKMPTRYSSLVSLEKIHEDK
jgi:hypothetical protein